MRISVGWRTGECGAGSSAWITFWINCHIGGFANSSGCDDFSIKGCWHILLRRMCREGFESTPHHEWTLHYLREKLMFTWLAITNKFSFSSTETPAMRRGRTSAYRRCSAASVQIITWSGGVIKYSRLLTTTRVSVRKPSFLTSLKNRRRFSSAFTQELLFFTQSFLREFYSEFCRLFLCFKKFGDFSFLISVFIVASFHD